jgi:hypothetical protein
MLPLSPFLLAIAHHHQASLQNTDRSSSDARGDYLPNVRHHPSRPPNPRSPKAPPKPARLPQPSQASPPPNNGIPASPLIQRPAPRNSPTPPNHLKIDEPRHASEMMRRSRLPILGLFGFQWCRFSHTLNLPISESDAGRKKGDRWHSWLNRWSLSVHHRSISRDRSLPNLSCSF